jgi:hypothetical protein
MDVIEYLSRHTPFARRSQPCPQRIEELDNVVGKADDDDGMAIGLAIKREAVNLSNHCATEGNVRRNLVCVFRELNVSTEAERAGKPLQLREVHPLALHVSPGEEARLRSARVDLDQQVPFGGRRGSRYYFAAAE